MNVAKLLQSAESNWQTLTKGLAEMAKKKVTSNTRPAKTAGKKKGTTKMVSATLDRVETDNEISEEVERYRRIPPAELRRGSVTIDELRSLQRVLTEHAVMLNTITDLMTKNAMTSLDSVDGITKGPRGRKLISEFCANLNRSLMSAVYG